MRANTHIKRNLLNQNTTLVQRKKRHNRKKARQEKSTLYHGVRRPQIQSLNGENTLVKIRLT